MGKSIRERIGDVFRRYVTDDDELSAVLGGAPILTALTLDSLTTLPDFEILDRLEIFRGRHIGRERSPRCMEQSEYLLLFFRQTGTGRLDHVTQCFP